PRVREERLCPSARYSTVYRAGLRQARVHRLSSARPLLAPRLHSLDRTWRAPFALAVSCAARASSSPAEARSVSSKEEGLMGDVAQEARARCGRALCGMRTQALLLLGILCLGSADLRSMPQGVFGLCTAPCTLERLGKRLIAYGKSRVERDGRLRHFNGV